MGTTDAAAGQNLDPELMTDYAIAFGVILAVNLLPAFGPPTWSVLVLLTLNFGSSR